MWFILGTIVLSVFLILIAWRLIDERRTMRIWHELKNLRDKDSDVFDPDYITDLPEPVRRFFLRSIKKGTNIRTCAELDMVGEISLGTKEKPNYMPLRAKQILSPPYGFIWKVSAGKGLMQFVGSDGAYPDGSWSIFWLLGFIPVARAGGNQDHERSSFGRYMSEAVFWLPSFVLPSENITWESIDSDTARVTIKKGAMELCVTLIVNELGEVTTVSFDRWSNENEERVFRYQPFGGYLSEYEDFDGYRLPTKIEAGNHFGTDKYFPFFKVKIKDVKFPFL